MRLRRSSINNKLKTSKTSKTSSSSGAEVDMDAFHFHLYVSFPRRSDSVGLDLFEALEAYCKREQIPNFTLHTRLSQEKINPQRWNEQFIRQEIAKFGVQDIRRVWVCGPPVMNETFDRVFSSAVQAHQANSQVESETLLGG
mmetsp:Transcript_6602/g.8960  ORF Transcript_6602/g.8960 Transcript_6602/m.8960 type:complete len:142 (+) Transcript_6602:3288-3713(+)